MPWWCYDLQNLCCQHENWNRIKFESLWHGFGTYWRGPGKKVAKANSTLWSPTNLVSGFFWRYRRYIQAPYVPNITKGTYWIGSVEKKLLKSETPTIIEGNHCIHKVHNLCQHLLSWNYTSCPTSMDQLSNLPREESSIVRHSQMGFNFAP